MPNSPMSYVVRPHIGPILQMGKGNLERQSDVPNHIAGNQQNGDRNAKGESHNLFFVFTGGYEVLVHQRSQLLSRAVG